MTADDDFSGYVGARWPALVRTLVLLGCPLDLAPDVAAAGLGRCRRGWREAAAHDDLDVVVHRAVLEAWDERLRGPWWSGLSPRTDEDWPLPDLSALDRLTPDVRTGLVLRRFASLDPAQAVAVAGREAGGPLPALPDAPSLRAAGDAVVVYAPPTEDQLVEQAATARRRWLVPAVGTLAAVLVLGGGTWWANRGDEGVVGLAPVEPTRANNAADLSWYAEGLLHLANATYRLPDVRQVVTIGAGAVYGDDGGDVVHLADDGTRTLLGDKRPYSPLAASEGGGRVAWVDPDGSTPRLLVYDLSQNEIVGELDLPPSAGGPDDLTDTRPVAFDGDRLYYATANGWGAWVVGEPEPDETGEGDLYDVQNTNRLYQVDERSIILDQPFARQTFTVPGRGGELSEDGNYAWTHSPDDGAILVYDTRTGEQVDIAPPFAASVVDVALAPESAITYLTLDTDAFPSQDGSDSVPLEGSITTCDLDDSECETAVTFVVQSEGPLLAR